MYSLVNKIIPIAAAVGKLGWSVVAVKPYSAIPGDEHLSVVLSQKPDNTYVLHTFNSASDNLYGGHYLDTLKQGLKSFHNRGI
jgi:hypothetical protein